MNPLFKIINIIFMKKQLIFLFLLSFCGIAFAQKKDTLKTEVIRVVKPFAPTVGDAEKISQEPKIDSVAIDKKREVNYTFNSVPVASTFIPEKGAARSLARMPKERFYNNYVSLGFGNYLTPYAEIFAHSNLTKSSDFGGLLKYQASFGDIQDVELESGYSDLTADLFYKQTERYFDWQVTGGIKSETVNWYGLSDVISFTSNTINSIDPKQSYGTIYLGGAVNFDEALVHHGELKVINFIDDFKSSEFYVNTNANIEFPVWELLMNSFITLEYVRGSFDEDFQNEAINYNYFNVGFSPNFSFYNEYLSLNVGANLWYSMTNNRDESSKFYAYPNVTASYKVNEENLIAYAGVTGDLKQNTYREFVDENPFVSPTLDVLRTSQPYFGFIGAKGKILSDLSFNFKAGYGSEKDKPLFKLNTAKTNGNIALDDGYAAGNSFKVVYDDVNTIQIFGEVIYDFDNHFKIGGNFEFNSYETNLEEYAWNLPMFKAAIITKYLRKKWYAGADLYFHSDRKDELMIDDAIVTLPTGLERVTPITNSAFVDLNLNAGYYFNDHWSTFLKLNNVLNQNYQDFTNFEVQGFQVLGGFTYRFDFD